MSIIGVGTDLCEGQRLARIFNRFGERFSNRLLTPLERTQKVWKAPALARRWAIKEAVAKALGTGIGGQVGFQDIEVTSTPKGAVVCRVAKRPDVKLHVSVSDDGDYSVAFCVAEEL